MRPCKSKWYKCTQVSRKKFLSAHHHQILKLEGIPRPDILDVTNTQVKPLDV